MASPTHTQPAVVRADADKRALKTTILELRRLLEADLGKQLRRLGIDGARTAPVAASTLSYLAPDEVEARTVLDGVLAKERLAVSSYAAAVEAVLREAVYTHLNRLVGLKCLELRRHLVIDGETTEAVTCRPEFGGRSKWLWTLRDRHPEYRHGEDAEERLWREGLTLACAAVSEQIQILFDPADPYAQVWPSYRALRDTVDALNRLPEDVFRADETLGWVYQYFQTDEKARVLEEERTKKKKTGWPDIIPRTSLYTERYMVDFLLQNSLGALWMEMYPDSTLAASWPYYVKPATPYTREPKPVRQWRLLDPAEGSGHFLVVAFDLFRQLYAEERRLAAEGKVAADWVVPEEEVAATILSQNLHGIDIDPRSVQISALALWLKAREAGLSAPPRLNLVVADCVLGEGEAYEQLLAKHADRPLIQEAIRTIWRSLQNVRELGSLIRVEEELAEAVQEVAKRERRQSPLFESVVDWDSFRHELLADLREAFKTEAKTEDIGHRLFGAEGQKGLDLVETLSGRYDVVCTNPPYMSSGNTAKALKDFLSKHYSLGRRDLYAAFILRSQELARADSLVAVVTPHSWMFNQRYVDLRVGGAERNPLAFAGLLRALTIRVIAHLGAGAFDEGPKGFDYGIAAAVLAKRDPANSRLVALRAVSGKSASDKKTTLLRGLADPSPGEGIVFVARQDQFLLVEGAPLCYWLGQGLLAMFQLHPKAEEFVEPLRGLNTNDDPRFVRYFWEVSDARWVRYAKGGGYAKWAGLEHWCVLWGRRGEYLDAAGGAIIPSRHRYGEECCVYTDVAAGNLGVRFFSPGGIFGDKGPGVLGETSVLYALAPVLNSRIASTLLRSISPSVQFRTGYVRKLPVPQSCSVDDALRSISRVARQLKSSIISLDPTEHSFCLSNGERYADKVLIEGGYSEVFSTSVALHTLEAWMEQAVLAAYQLEEADTAAVIAETGEPAGWFPLVSGHDTLPDSWTGLIDLSGEVANHLSSRDRRSLGDSELASLKDRLRSLYERGPGAKDEPPTERGDKAEETLEDQEDEPIALGAYSPIPPETYIEELSQKLETHPLSVYWLLEELRRDEGLVCPHELKRHTEDYFSVKLIRMLGHRWPMQDRYETEEGRPFIDHSWVDEDGIIPLTAGTGEEILADRFSRFLDEEFGAERGHAVELEAGQTLGWKPGDEWGKQTPTTLGRWFEREFFKRHVSQFKKRPIAWHLSSPRGAFQAIVYYHKFNRNRLQLVRSRYVRQALDELRRQLAGAMVPEPDRKAVARIAELEAKVADVEEFEVNLGRLLEGRDREARIWCPWKKAEEQPVGWDRDINDGVRVNIAPVQRLGLLAADVLTRKDLNSLLAPEGRL